MKNSWKSKGVIENILKLNLCTSILDYWKDNTIYNIICIYITTYIRTKKDLHIKNKKASKMSIPRDGAFLFLSYLLSRVEYADLSMK